MKAADILPLRHVFAMECGKEFFIFPPDKHDRFSPVRSKVERCFDLKYGRRRRYRFDSENRNLYLQNIHIEGEVFKLVYLRPDYSLRWGWTA